jgi:hypothetical protein
MSDAATIISAFLCLARFLDDQGELHGAVFTRGSQTMFRASVSSTIVAFCAALVMSSVTVAAAVGPAQAAPSQLSSVARA